MVSALTALLAASPAALAASDLEVSIPAPAAAYVYDVSTIDVVVSNTGNRHAQSVSLTVALPETNTSPTVHVMGDLDAYDGRCSPSGTELVCSLGRIRKGQSTTVSLDISLPQVEGGVVISADATTSSREDSTTNNSDSVSPAQLNDAVTVSGGDDATNDHCTGTGLTSYFECELYPSSISSHDTTFNGDGSVSFAGSPAGYSGSWWQPSGDSLAFEYTYNGDVVAEFVGYGVSADCFEGVTTFPGSSWVSPYQVCLW